MFPFFPDVHGAPFNGDGGHELPDALDGGHERRTPEQFESIERLTGTAAEFPRIDDRYAGAALSPRLAAGDGYAPPGGAARRQRGGLLMNCLFHKDLATGDEQHWWCGPVSSLQEACFIPRHKAAPEGDGWIVQICNRLEEHRSDLLLFDALQIAEGPIATINIPFRMRFGLHGNWADAAEIGLAA